MTTPATPAPGNVPAPAPNWFADSATRLNIILWLAPFSLTFVGFLLSNAYATTQNTQDIAQAKAAIVAFRDAKEERGTRLSVLEADVKRDRETTAQRLENMEKDIDTIQADIKTLLARTPERR